MSEAILYINSVPDIGGAEASLIELVSHLDRDKYKPVFLTTIPGRLSETMAKESVPVHYGDFPFFSRRRPWIFWRAVWRICALIRSHEIRLVHVNCDRAVPHAVIAANLTRVPVVCYIHDMTRAWFLPRYVRYLNRSQQIIADSAATAEHCLRAGMDPSRLRVIYECFEMDRFSLVASDDRARVRAEFSLSDSEIAVGVVGHVLRYKGHEEFLRAAHLIAEESPEARFFIVGDDRLSDDSDFLPFLQILSYELGLNEVMRFVGYREDIPAIMSALDIVVVPSWKEPFGRVVIEALATGTPVVATNAGGIPEIIDDGVNGLLVAPKSPTLLAKAVMELVECEELRDRLGGNGLSTVRRFDVAEHAAQFTRLYLALIPRKEPYHAQGNNP